MLRRQYFGLWAIALLMMMMMMMMGCGSDLPPDVRPNLQEVARIRSGLEPKDGPAAGTATEAASDAPTGYATLRGQFKLNGDAPPRAQLSITANPEVCAPGGKKVLARDLVVDPGSKGIAHVLIYADRIKPEWIHESLKTPAAPEVVFDQKECEFLTYVAAIQTSQKLLVKNSDPVGHNTKIKNFNDTIPSNQSTSYAFPKPDTLPQEVRCSIHPWMNAWFIARPDPYFAVTKPDGTFEIPQLPAGVEITFRVWQERFPSINGPVNVNGGEAKWSKGKFTLKLEPNTDAELNVVLDAPGT
jgi:hypothetical protein